MIAVGKLKKKSPDIDSELVENIYISICILHHSSIDSEIKGV